MRPTDTQDEIIRAAIARGIHEEVKEGFYVPDEHDPNFSLHQYHGLSTEKAQQRTNEEVFRIMQKENSRFEQEYQDSLEKFNNLMAMNQEPVDIEWIPDYTEKFGGSVRKAQNAYKCSNISHLPRVVKVESQRKKVMYINKGALKGRPDVFSPLRSIDPPYFKDKSIRDINEYLSSHPNGHWYVLEDCERVFYNHSKDRCVQSETDVIYRLSFSNLWLHIWEQHFGAMIAELISGFLGPFEVMAYIRNEDWQYYQKFLIAEEDDSSPKYDPDKFHSFIMIPGFCWLSLEEAHNNSHYVKSHTHAMHVVENAETLGGWCGFHLNRDWLVLKILEKLMKEEKILRPYSIFSNWVLRVLERKHACKLDFEEVDNLEEDGGG